MLIVVNCNYLFKKRKEEGKSNKCRQASFHGQWKTETSINAKLVLFVYSVREYEIVFDLFVGVFS